MKHLSPSVVGLWWLQEISHWYL